MVSAAISSSIRNVWDFMWWIVVFTFLVCAGLACNEHGNGLNPLEGLPIVASITPMWWLIIGFVVSGYFADKSSRSNKRAAEAEQRAEEYAAAVARQEQVNIAAEAQLKALRAYGAEVAANRGQ
jgi:hypothetical protein